MVVLTTDRIIIESYTGVLVHAHAMLTIDLDRLDTMHARDIIASSYPGAPIAIADVRIALRAARREVSSCN